MQHPKRFRDEQVRLSHFGTEVWVECPACAKKAIATRNDENYKARLLCPTCGYNKDASTQIYDGKPFIAAAHYYFGAKLWLTASFKTERFFAFNLQHLDYLERYIASGLRENPERIGFTMVEKLPRFMQVAKNREALLKLIAKLRARA